MLARIPALAALLVPVLLLPTSAGAAARPAPKPVKPSPQALALARAVRDDKAQARGAQARAAHLRQQLTALAAVEAAGERGAGGKRARLQQLTGQEEAL